jgi:hypothetical protein
MEKGVQLGSSLMKWLEDIYFSETRLRCRTGNFEVNETLRRKSL